MTSTPLTADAVVRALAGFTDAPRSHSDQADRLRWLAARFDAGDREGAATALLGTLGERLPPSFATEGPRILAVLPRPAVLAAVLGSPQLYARYRNRLGEHPDDAVAGTFARLVAGDAEAEDALLRAAAGPTEHERRYPNPSYRPARISAVIAAFAASFRGASSRDASSRDASVGGASSRGADFALDAAALERCAAALDRWAAVLAGSERDDRHRLAAAAALLGPLGLAEVDKRCGHVEDHDGPPLVAALGAAGRLGEALELAARLGPWARQLALLDLATTTAGADGAKVYAAFRKCPKTDRSRDSQMVWRHRLATLALRYDRVDDALATLAGMKDCRVSGYGPASLARQILRRFAERPEEATPARLRAVVAVLLSPAVITQELAAVAVEALILLFRLADPPLRTDLAGPHADAMRTALRRHSPGRVDAALAAVRVEAGDRHALDDVFGPEQGGWMGRHRMLVDVATAAGLPERRPETAATVAVAALGVAGDPAGVARLLPTAARAHLPRLLAELPAARALSVVTDLSGVATAAVSPATTTAGDAAGGAAAGGLELLAVALDAARDATAAHVVARHAAAALARAGDLPGALRVAAACAMPA